MSPFLLACLAYLTLALPGSTLGLIWPSMRFSFHEPVGALGILLVFGVAASVASSTVTGRVMSRVRVGQLLALGGALLALALRIEAMAPSLWIIAVGMMIFGFGFGLVDSVLNAYAANHFGARQVNWMHACFGLGATIGPLLVTALLSNGLGWRWTYGSMALALVVVTFVFAITRQGWETAPALMTAASPVSDGGAAGRISDPPRREPRTPVLISILTFTALETGLESGAGIWGYVFLTAGRGLSHDAAGVAVAAYWAMMFVGRVVLGPVAERVGAAGVLSCAVAGAAFGAALMVIPGPAIVAVVGMMTVGLAAAPIFPLFTLTTAQRVDQADTARTVGFEVAASAVGGAALPAGMGLAIGAFNARALAPSLFVLGLAMCAVYASLSRGDEAWGRSFPASASGEAPAGEVLGRHLALRYPR